MSKKSTSTDFRYVQTVLRIDTIRQLTKRAGTTIMKDALARAIEHYIKCHEEMK